MSQRPAGRRLKLSPGRRLVVEWMHHARKVPSLPLAKSFNLAELVVARQEISPQISWMAIFMKAYGLLARDHPVLRRAYVRWPIPHLYEHPYSECALLVERQWLGESVVFGGKIRGPENRSLPDLHARIRRYRDAPISDINYFRRLMRLARMPWPLRRFLVWQSLYLSGAIRARRFGTFVISSMGGLGVEQFHPLSFLTTYLSFGPISPAGEVVVKIIYDHNVMDDRNVARCLNDLERVLLQDILSELKALKETNG